MFDEDVVKENGGNCARVYGSAVFPYFGNEKFSCAFRIFWSGF